MTPKAIVEFVIAIAAGLLLFFVASTIRGWYVKAQEAELSEAVIETTSGINKDGDAAAVERTRVDTTLTEARARYRAQVEQTNEADPVLRKRAATPVDQRVLDNFRQARLARERSGSLGEQGEGKRPEKDAAER